MSSTASPTLNLFVNAASVVESASATADGDQERDRGEKEQTGLQVER